MVLHDYLDQTWEQARGQLKEELEQLRARLNAKFNTLQTPDGTLTAGVADGDSTIDTVYISNEGTGHTPEWAQINLVNGVKNRLLFANVEQLGPSTLAGRGSAAGPGSLQGIVLGSGLSMSGTTLSSTAGAGTSTFLTDTDETATLPNSRRVIAGNGISFDDSVAGERTVSTTVPMHYVVVSLTNDEIKALPDTYKTIVAAPGAGKALLFHFGWFSFDASGGGWTNITTGSEKGFEFAYGDWANDVSNYYNQWDGSSFRGRLGPISQIPDAEMLLSAFPGSEYGQILENTAIKFIAWNDAGHFTGGGPGSSGLAAVSYSILDTTTGALT